MAEALLGTLLGFMSGMRHALEPDHLAAVSTVIAERRSSREAASYAALWGMGHAATLLLVGGGLFLARREMSPAVSDRFELLVAVMLVALGVRALVSIRRDVRAHAAAHRAALPHVHTRLSARPVAIGLVHGLAGSGALTALVASKSLSMPVGLAFMLVYGLGAALGMVSLAGLLGVPIAKLVRDGRWASGLVAASGVVAVLCGVVWGVRALHVM